MDYRNELFTAIFNLLNGNVVIEGSAVEVGTKITSESDKFVRYYVQSDENIGTRDSDIRELNIGFDCVTRQPLHLGDGEASDSMVNQVKALLLDEDNYNVIAWHVVVTSDQGTETDSGEMDNYYMNVRTFSLKIIIEKI